MSICTECGKHNSFENFDGKCIFYQWEEASNQARKGRKQKRFDRY